MSNRFSYVKYTPESVAKQEAFKSMFEAIESYAVGNLQDSRPRSLFLTALEEAYMWTGKAIRDEQQQNEMMKIPMGGMISNSPPLTPTGAHRPERG